MDDLVLQLRTLSDDTTHPTKIRNRAKALYDRLTMPVRVAVAGPDANIAAQVIAALPDDAPLLVRTDTVESADVAIWCTVNFGQDEVAFWDAAAPNLQDHSLLVGPMNAHVQDMGNYYFRQTCTAENVVQTLVRQIKRGREADADQALALLARHPTTKPVTAPPIAQTTTPAEDCKIVAFLQEQANVLAAMDITDTTASCERVLAVCAETAQELTIMVATEPDKSLQDAVYDASDAITLMLLEGDMSAAADAVATLIEIQKRFKNAAANVSVRQLETIAVP